MRPLFTPTRVANANYSPSIGHRLSCRLCEIGHGLPPADFRARCGPEVARLEAMPEGALRSMGLSRSDAMEFVVGRILAG
jgi:hypothetical protein